MTAALFAGRRGRLLAGLLLAEFAGALQSVAYSSVLPLASAELDGGSLYGATVAATALTTILVLSAGPRLLTRFSATHTLVIATVFYVIGVLLAATAPAMGFVLAGSIVRGFASGLLTGFALTAVGALYDEEVRPRVVGLFAVMWVLPALLGPPLNSAIAVAFGWRWAMAWPAVLVVAARILVGRQAEIVPWHRSKQTSELGNGSLVLCGLVIASCASAVNAAWAIAPFVLGLLLAAWASRRTLRGLLGDSPQSLRSTTTFLTLCLAFFGGAGLVALGVIEGLRRGAVAGSAAVGAGLLAWSLTGLRPPKRDLRVVGLVMLAVALAAEAVAQALPMAPAVAVAVAAWAVAGLGMGLAYPRLYAAPLDGLAAEQVAPAATAVEFAELSGTAIGALVGAGVYSLGDGLGLAAGPSIATGFALLSALATVAVVLAATPQLGGASLSRRLATSSSFDG